MLFAHLKSIMKFGQLRLRGPTGINDEFLLAAIAQNLRKMAKLHGGRLQPNPAYRGSRPVSPCLPAR